MKNFASAWTMVLAVIIQSDIASGKRVETHIIVNKYWLPRLVLGNGPTQSIVIRLNGSSKTGIGFSGALGIT